MERVDCRRSLRTNKEQKIGERALAAFKVTSHIDTYLLLVVRVKNARLLNSSQENENICLSVKNTLGHLFLIQYKSFDQDLTC